VYYLPEVASATWKPGSPLVRDANGFMAECAADPTTLWGFAVENGQNLASSGLKKCAVYRPRPGERFEGTLVGTWALTMLGENYGLLKNATTLYWEIVPAETEDTVTVMSVSSRVAVGTVDPIVDFSVDEANLQEI